MHLVTEITRAVPFGLQASADNHATEIARDCASGVEVEVVPYDAPYGPWWVIQVKAGALIRYIADDQPAVLV